MWSLTTGCFSDVLGTRRSGIPTGHAPSADGSLSAQQAAVQGVAGDDNV